MNMNPFRQMINRLNVKRPASEPARHARRAYQRKATFSFSFTMLVITLIFLFLPLFVIIAYSFNQGKSSTFTGFSLEWYKKLFFASGPLWTALLNSFIVAFASAALATILGSL
ncbi:MAG: spermidine/putrescine ABC transporter permease PotC, partial [Ignavibacteria bacterium]|nr:spermidine/putrescine ABC transporter permease PotC [Ignavibacteria bacterium]